MTLQFAPLAPHVWSALEALPRTGWKELGIRDPESVADHTRSVMAIADDLVSQRPEFSGLRRDHLIAMLEVHEWPESNPTVGDQISRITDPARICAERYRREKAAMEEICASLGSMGNRIFNLWQRFERAKDEVAKLARALDKYQAIELAFHYEREGKGPKGLGLEFLHGSPPIHPLLQARFAQKCVLSA